MASGKPVVAFGFGAINEIISDRVNGLIAINQDLQDLEAKLLTLLEDRNLREKMGREARITAEKFFNIEIEAKNYEEVYMKLLN